MLINDYQIYALKQSAKAIKEGALIPLKTKLSKLSTNEGTHFQIRQLTSLFFSENKVYGPKANPFFPWDRRLEISNINHDHVLILNKYPVQLGHMLLITNNWAPQNGWLSSNDWKALENVDKITSGLWFFNSGPEAGASQPHRHLQLLPRISNSMICPREGYFLSLIKGLGENNYHKDFGFIIKKRSTSSNIPKYRLLYNDYLTLAAGVNLGEPETTKMPLDPYNLLICKKWIVLIKRRNDFYRGFNVNALGYAGYLLATQESDMDWLKDNGPEELLKRLSK